VVALSATTFHEIRIRVDPTFVAGHAQPRAADGLREVWPLVMERAYAEYRGSHNAIARGGHPWTAMQAINGRLATRIELSDRYGTTELQRDIAAGKLVVLETKKGQPLGRGLEEGHAYAVTGTEERDGRLWVRLQNPWGVGDTESIPSDEIGRWFLAVDVGSVR
jgi:hypothetical protein